MINYTEEILKSLIETKDTENTLESIVEWVDDLNKNTHVKLTQVDFKDCKGWFYNEKTGQIQNENGTFFKIAGLEFKMDDEIHHQPIILQNEIGFLGIVCKKIKGVLHFLMQAKIEPGNINKIQISPTIQATKSNFTQKHSGRKPKYLEFFENAKNYTILYDQIQSEQSSRFLGKRNRNIVIDIGGSEIFVEKNWKWMTLGQLKELLKYDNLVNMDTRTVISGLYLNVSENSKKIDWFEDENYFEMIKDTDFNNIQRIYNYINDFKMFHDFERKTIDLKDLKDWDFNKREIVKKGHSSFKVVFYEIEIEGREVRKWYQPLFQAIGKAKFILLTSILNGKRIFLVKPCFEVGAFDFMEIGPTIQKESNISVFDNILEEKVFELIERKNGIVTNVVLSEEGGRFYHEENDNIIIDVDYKEFNDIIRDLDGYFWLDYSTLQKLMRVNNVLNIQLRNLISLIDIDRG